MSTTADFMDATVFSHGFHAVQLNQISLQTSRYHRERLSRSFIEQDTTMIESRLFRKKEWEEGNQREIESTLFTRVATLVFHFYDAFHVTLFCQIPCNFSILLLTHCPLSNNPARQSFDGTSEYDEFTMRPTTGNMLFFKRINIASRTRQSTIIIFDNLTRMNETSRD